MLRFSVRQLLLAIVAVALGLSIWRLPKGSWLDLAPVALSFYFVISLCRSAAATRRLLIEGGPLDRQQLWGGRLLIAALLATALALVAAWVFRYLAAAEILLAAQDEDSLYYVEYPTLPRDLAVLAMLVAIGIPSWRSGPDRKSSARQNLYGAVAATGTVFLLIAYWADRMLVWYLVYVALSGVEMAQHPGALPPDVDPNQVVRIDRFVQGGLVGLATVATNLLLIWGLIKCWSKTWWRCALLLCLAVGMAAQTVVAAWIGSRGIYQLSPPFHEAIEIAPAAVMIVIGGMTLLAAGAFTWRLLARRSEIGNMLPCAAERFVFHESWLGSLLLGVIATIPLAVALTAAIADYLSPRWLGTRWWDAIVYGLTYYPAQLISLAAAIGGFSLAAVRWWWRKAPARDVLPCLDPVEFAITTISLCVLVVTAAPIIAALGFNYWTVQLGY